MLCMNVLLYIRLTKKNLQILNNFIVGKLNIVCKYILIKNTKNITFKYLQTYDDLHNTENQ